MSGIRTTLFWSRILMAQKKHIIVLSVANKCLSLPNVETVARQQTLSYSRSFSCYLSPMNDITDQPKWDRSLVDKRFADDWKRQAVSQHPMATQWLTH